MKRKDRIPSRDDLPDWEVSRRGEGGVGQSPSKPEDDLCVHSLLTQDIMEQSVASSEAINCT